jgi:hypothetical protein
MEVENSDLEAYLFGSAITGCLLQYIHLKEDYSLDEMKHYLINKFCT